MSQSVVRVTLAEKIVPSDQDGEEWERILRLLEDEGYEAFAITEAKQEPERFDHTCPRCGAMLRTAWLGDINDASAFLKESAKTREALLSGPPNADYHAASHKLDDIAKMLDVLGYTVFGDGLIWDLRSNNAYGEIDLD